MNSTPFQPSWVDTTLYPFKNYYLQLKAGNMHYIDEGKGETILFIHGTPTWSFLYRDFIKGLSTEYRCIAIDHLGFGLSEKPEFNPGTPEWHSQNLSEFINKLDLKNITLVVHDFGGPIGLSSGIKNSERIKQVVLFNTWLWKTKTNPNAQKINKIVNSKVGKFLYLNMNFSPKTLLKKGFSDKKTLSKKVHQQYLKPFPNKKSRITLLNLAKALVGSSDWYQKQWANLNELEQKPWLVIWGMRDDFISTEHLKKWKERLTNVEIKELECGHFVQEEKTPESINAIHNFMKK